MKRRNFILSLLGIPAVVKGLGKESLSPFEKERIFRDSLIKKNVNICMGLEAHLEGNHFSPDAYQGINRSTVGHEFLQAYMKPAPNCIITEPGVKESWEKLLNR